MITSGFFNSVNHDRLYDAEQLSAIFDGVIADGVYENYGSAFLVTPANQNSAVVVGTGRAWFDHTWTLNDAPFVIEMDPPNEMVTRIDTIAIDVDRRKETRKNSIVYVKGDPTEQAPPTLIDEELHKQYPICYINRAPGPDGTVSQSEIEYNVGTEECPIVNGLLQAQNLENLWKQLEAEFGEWWQSIRDIIGGDDPTIDFINRLTALEKAVEDLENNGSLLDNDVIAAFKSGDYGLSSSSFTVATLTPYSGSRVLSDVYPSSRGTGVEKRNLMYPLALAPNGEVVGIGGYGLRNATVANPTHLLRITTDGVKTKSAISGIKSIASLVSSDTHKYVSDESDGGPDPSPHLISFDASTFPIRAVFAYAVARCNTEPTYENYMRGNVKLSCVSYTITIASDGVVSGSSSKVVDYPNTFNVGTGDWAQGVNDTAFCSPTKAGNCLLWCGLDGEGTTERKFFKNATIFRVNSDGVISGGTTDVQNKLVSFSDCSNDDNSHGADGKAYQINTGSTINYNQTPCWSEIDEDTLNVTFHNSSFLDDNGSYPSQTITNCEVESFNLSEAQGFQSKYRSAGVEHSTATSTKKIRPYYLGATNADGGLPEGDCLAVKDGDIYYAIGPSGENIAIGSDGGSAILKKKTPLSISFNLDSVYYKTVGYVNSGVLSYLVFNNLSTSNEGSINASCITLKRSENA